MSLGALVRLLLRVLFSLSLGHSHAIASLSSLCPALKKKKNPEHPHIKSDFVFVLAVSSRQVHLCLPYCMLAPLGKKSWPNIYNSSSLAPGG